MNISGEVLAFLLVGSFFATIILVSFFRIRKSERMAMWASGKDLKDQVKPQVPVNINQILKYGLLLVGLGFGLVIGEILYNTNVIATQEVAYFSMLLLFGGAGLLTSYTLLNKNKKSDHADL